MHALIDEIRSLKSRRRAAILAESAQVARNGGRAAIVVDTFRPWKDEAMPTGVELIGVGALERDRPLVRFVDRYVVRAPDKLLRMAGRGPLRTFTRRLRRAYKTRVAKPIQGRATSAHRRLTRVHEFRSAEDRLQSWISSEEAETTHPNPVPRPREAEPNGAADRIGQG